MQKKMKIPKNAVRCRVKINSHKMNSSLNISDIYQSDNDLTYDSDIYHSDTDYSTSLIHETGGIIG